MESDEPSADPSANQSPSRYAFKAVRLASVVILVSVCLALWASFSTDSVYTLEEEKLVRKSNQGVHVKCNDKKDDDDLSLRHLLADYSTLANHLTEQRNQMEEAAKVNYSHYYEDLFYVKNENATTRTSRGKLAFFDPVRPQGWDTLKSRLKLKILGVQESLLLAKQNQEVTPCANQKHKPEAKWVHAVAGHSSSAGHGNFAEESYGAVMNAAISPMLQSIGIELETRVYGMSGKRSFPEMAFCQEAVLGMDVDLLTWDYALTDGPERWHFEFWMQRASILKSQPVITSALLHPKYNAGVAALYESHPDLPFMAMKSNVVKDMEAAVPDSLEDSDLPPLLQLFRCGSEFLEVNDLCEEHKFKRDICPDRYWMAAWHPGFKRLALEGNLLALFLADALQEAVDELQTEMSPGPVELKAVRLKLLELTKEKEQQVKRIQSANYQPGLGQKRKSPSEDFPGLNSTWIYQSRSLCRTFRLPSQQRYKQISTGHPVVSYGLDPEEGLEHEGMIATWGTDVNRTVEDALDVKLGYDDKVRHSQANCSRITNIDFADYMYVTDTWRKAILPSPDEAHEYFSGKDDEPHEFHGIILICPLNCKEQSKACYDSEILGGWDRINIQVNGVEVKEMTPFFSKEEECGILSHKGGYEFPAREDGKYDIRMRLDPDMMKNPRVLQVPSIVLL